MDLTKNPLQYKSTRLFLFLGSFFLANALIAEFIGVKIFSLEKVLGFEPFALSMFGEDGLSFDLTAGVLLWPVVFIMTDVINEYFGKSGVRLLSFIAAGLITYAFIMFFLAINTHPSDFWVFRATDAGKVDMQLAFATISGQGNWIIAGSLVAFLVGQLIDVYVFHFIKKITGDKYIWLRATGSTLVSQFIDSFIVLFIAFYFNPNTGWSATKVFAIGVVNYSYKFTMAIVLTPLIYVAHGFIERYLGHDEALRLKTIAMAEDKEFEAKRSIK